MHSNKCIAMKNSLGYRVICPKAILIGLFLKGGKVYYGRVLSEDVTKIFSLNGLEGILRLDDFITNKIVQLPRNNINVKNTTTTQFVKLTL